jgi:hypothetical protein
MFHPLMGHAYIKCKLLRVYKLYNKINVDTVGSILFYFCCADLPQYTEQIQQYAYNKSYITGPIPHLEPFNPADGGSISNQNIIIISVQLQYE